MKVAVTFRTLSDSNRRKIAPYIDALRAAGLDPVCVTPDAPSPLDGFRGLVLTGGSDINPALYGEAINGSEKVDDARDRLESDLCHAALDSDRPILAICRGEQLLNVVHSGSLIQDLTSKSLHQCKPRDAEAGKHPAAHSVDVAEGTHLARIVGAGLHDVNSRHHQAADRIGAGLTVSARSEDGVIEGLERADRTFVVAVQWHPEDRILVSDADRKLFQAFASAVR